MDLLPADVITMRQFLLRKPLLRVQAADGCHLLAGQFGLWVRSARHTGAAFGMGMLPVSLAVGPALRMQAQAVSVAAWQSFGVQASAIAVAASIAALCVAVSYVGLVRSCEQMVHSHTGRVVAGMEKLHPDWQRSVLTLPREASRPAPLEHSVSVFVGAASPEPAAVASLDVGVEPVSGDCFWHRRNIWPL